MSHKHPQILMLDAQGNPRDWITFEVAAYYEAKEMIAWRYGDKFFTIYGGENAASGRQSFMDLSTIIAIKGDGIAKALSRTPPLTNQALFRRDHHQCAFCGNYFKQNDLTRDHVHPTSRGGKDNWMNCVAACGPCNKRKNNRTPSEANMPLLYQPYAPTMAEYLILRNRMILADQYEFLASRVSKDSRIKPMKELNTPSHLVDMHETNTLD